MREKRLISVEKLQDMKNQGRNCDQEVEAVSIAK